MTRSKYTDSGAINPVCVGDGCAECSRLLKRYEALTFEAARIDNRLALATCLHDPVAVEQMKQEALALDVWRKHTHAALIEHQGGARRLAAGG